MSMTTQLPRRARGVSSPAPETVTRLLGLSALTTQDPTAWVDYPTMADHAREWGMAVADLAGSVPFRGFTDPGAPVETVFAETIAALLLPDDAVTIVVSDLPAAPELLAIGPATGVLTLADLPEAEATP